MPEIGPLLLEWKANREEGLQWQSAPELADPTRSSLWEHYLACARVTAPNNWTLPGASCGGSMGTLTIPRLVEPKTYYEHGLELYARLSSPTPSDDLVACAMRLAVGMLAVEMAAEGMQYSYQEGYNVLCDVMGPETARVAKSFDLVGRWMGGVGILGITNERFVEVRAVIVLLAELLELPLDPPDRLELQGFFQMLVSRALSEQEGPAARAFRQQVLERLPAGSSLRGIVENEI